MDSKAPFPRRAASAARTREALLTAAAELFIEVGYQAATIQGIADRAGVARPTVFTSVPGGKPQLLKEARDRALAGDDEPIPVPQRPWFREAMAQTDPRGLLRRQAGNWAMMNGRAAGLERALARGADTDASLAELWREAQRQRHFGTLMVARRLAELTPLPHGVDYAADVMYALAAPELYLILTEERTWTTDAYHRWLGQQLILALLPKTSH